MPELPEVETVRGYLESKILNKEIKEVDVLFSKLIKNVLEKDFKEKILGQKIVVFGDMNGSSAATCRVSCSSFSSSSPWQVIHLVYSFLRLP